MPIPAKSIKTALFLLFVVLVGLRRSGADSSLDGERLNLEMTMQTRVEEALSKIIPRSQFVVVIRVEPIPKIVATKEAEQQEDQNGFYLPGVPSIKKYDGSVEALNRLATELKPEREVYHKFIKRILVVLVLDQDLPEATVGRVRDLTRQMLSLDPARGDTMDIQRTAFQKPAAAPVIADTEMTKFLKSLKDYWVLISLSLILFCITVFFLFIFGPLRGFLNRFLQVLPTLRPADIGNRGALGGIDPQILPALMAQSLGLPVPTVAGGANFSGSLQVENPNKRTTPFSFVREDHLSNLALLLSHEAADKAAVVLGYLPTEWISRVLSKLDQNFQTEITNQLATTRQLLPEQVEDIEQDLKRRLDYMVGGPDRIYAVYDTVDQDAQRRMLENLKLSRPDIAEELRKRTFFFEDLERLESTSLRAILREVDLQTMQAGLKGLSADFVSRLLEHLPEGKAEIVRQELELGNNAPNKMTVEAQKRISAIARRLMKEGDIQIVHMEEPPQTRFGPSLRSTIKLPPGLAFKESQKTPTEEAQVVQADPGSIQERIKRFMNRRKNDQRFPDPGKGK